MLGFELGRVAFNMMDQYAGNLEAYAAWAEDWSLDDDLFEERTLRKAEEASLDELEGSAEFAMADGRVRAVNLAFKAAAFGGRVRAGAMFETYHKARYAIKAAGLKLQAHHIVEKRVLRALGLSTNGPAVALAKAQHQVITNLLRNALPYKGEKALKNMSRAQIKAAYRKAYERFPELLSEALRILDE